jgi:hypothetical protein
MPSSTEAEDEQAQSHVMMILLADDILRGRAGWKVTSLLVEDILGVVHIVPLICGTWISLLICLSAANQHVAPGSRACPSNRYPSQLACRPTPRLLLIPSALQYRKIRSR